jgi:hypothetical protein
MLFEALPEAKKKATVWLIANIIHYVIISQNKVTVAD